MIHSLKVRDMSRQTCVETHAAFNCVFVNVTGAIRGPVKLYTLYTKTKTEQTTISIINVPASPLKT